MQELMRQNGEGIARSILAMSEMHTCPDPDRFVVSLRDMFNGLDPEVIRTRTSEVLQDMIEELRQHQVSARAAAGCCAAPCDSKEAAWMGCADRLPAADAVSRTCGVFALVVVDQLVLGLCSVLAAVLVQHVLFRHRRLSAACHMPVMLCAVACQVTLKATVSTVVVTTLVLEGWSRELNPDLHIMDALRDMLAVDWKERLSRAVDKVGGEGG
eukprot:GHRQ01015584.1.p1 GENE.GHRQ01015584.1~~GHRQ01015584.1.p1  ORF type:complete len:213 (-),score=97.64 GHRQ01015584.1:222-860(-)